MTVTIFIVSLLGAMALGIPISYSLLVCGVSLMGWLAYTGGLPAFDYARVTHVPFPMLRT